LLVSPTKGLVLFFPAAIVAAVSRVERLAKYAALAASAVLLLLAAAYWGWHGNEGWGPRLILPCIPLLAPLAAVQLERWGRAATIAVVAICFLINLPPLVQHPTPIATYVTNLEWPRVGRPSSTESPRTRATGTESARTSCWRKFRQRIPGRSTPGSHERRGRAPNEVRADSGESALALGAPRSPAPARDHAVAGPLPHARAAVELLGARLRAAAQDDVAYRAVYPGRTPDQVVRLQQGRRAGESLDLARKLYELRPSGEAVALVLESYRLLSDTLRRRSVSFRAAAGLQARAEDQCGAGALRARRRQRARVPARSSRTRRPTLWERRFNGPSISRSRNGRPISSR
jgi:hypothetical protein